LWWGIASVTLSPRNFKKSSAIVEQGFIATTAGIRVTVRVFYLADQSKPEMSHFVWAYRIGIYNYSPVTVQLLERTWRITDAHGRVQIVEGEGVIGEQPDLEPGENFEYTSGVPLPTPSGLMTGQYHMIRTASGERFDVDIPTFSLDSPHENTRLN
jgi:ApaG protein